LIKSQAVRQAGSLCDRLSLPMALWDLFSRFHSQGLKVVCAEGVCPHHTRQTPEDEALDTLRIAKERLADAEAFFHEGRFQEAEEILRQILQKHPEYPDAHNDLACLLWQTNRTDEALGELLSVMELIPGHRDAIWNLGQFLKAMGQDHDAFQTYSNYVKNHPEEREMAETLGQWERTPTGVGERLSVRPDHVQEMRGG